MGVKISKDVIFNKLKELFKDYEFDMSMYKNTHSKIKVVCSEHGESYKIVKNLLKGHGCKKCGNKSASEKQRLELNNLIENLNKIHNNKYDYSKFLYKNNRTPGIIICPEHGEFKQCYRSHSIGHGCPYCSGNKRLSGEEFIRKSNIMHKNKYNYEFVEYKNMHSKVDIQCEKHGIFQQLPLHHIRGVGCPKCNQSKGELMIENFLKKNNINYMTQKRFEDCFYINQLLFDFYLPDYKTCIEFNGIQHYQSLDVFGGDKAFELNKIRDNIKKEYCLKNNIQLIIIKQDKKHINIEDVNLQINKIPDILKINK